jgi:hypothetical protein
MTLAVVKIRMRGIRLRSCIPLTMRLTYLRNGLSRREQSLNVRQPIFLAA